MIRKTLLILLIFIIIFTIGCIANRQADDNKNNDVWCLISYENNSGMNMTGEVIILTEGREVFNSTILFNEKHGDIFREEASDGSYLIQVKVGNNTEKFEFKPNGQNILTVSVSPYHIEIQEITD